jgi:hypothetical protein
MDLPDCNIGSQAGKINDEVSPGPVNPIGVRGLSNRIPWLFQAGRGRRVERRVSTIDRQPCETSMTEKRFLSAGMHKTQQ